MFMHIGTLGSWDRAKTFGMSNVHLRKGLVRDGVIMVRERDSQWGWIRNSIVALHRRASEGRSSLSRGISKGVRAWRFGEGVWLSCRSVGGANILLHGVLVRKETRFIHSVNEGGVVRACSILYCQGLEGPVQQHIPTLSLGGTV